MQIILSSDEIEILHRSLELEEERVKTMVATFDDAAFKQHLVEVKELRARLEPYLGG